jgi:DHA3 family macrolide efflux protein-like MFS transporter
MRRFGFIWSGQAVTLVGNSVLRFAFVVQAWTAGGQATKVVLLSMCALLPQVLLSPTAGALVDRLPKRLALQLPDIGGLAVVASLSAVYFSGNLRLWMIYLAVALLGTAAAFQYPALASAVPLLVRKEHLQRANGLLSTAKSTADIGGPALAALLIATTGFGAILWLDLASFVFAVVSVQLVRFPHQPAGQPGERPRRLGADSLEGLRYLFSLPSLRALVLVNFTANLVMVFGYAVVQPMVLDRSGDDTSALASVMTSIGIGGVAGGLLLGVWGGPKVRIRGMLLGIAGMCLTSQILMACSRGVVAWCAAMFAGALLVPIVNGTFQAVLQTKVPPDRLGRVFGAVIFVSQISAPVAMVSSGLLADRVFESRAATGSGLVGLLQPLLGRGPGSGMATMLFIAGVCGTAVALWGMAHRPLRDIEALVPDLDGPENATAASAPAADDRTVETTTGR